MQPRALLLAGLFLLSAGCASTRVGSTWTEPTLTAAEVPRKILVAAEAPTLSVRQQLEEQLALELRNHGVEAVPYSGAPSREQAEASGAVQDALREGNFDGLLVARVVGVNEQGHDPYGHYPYGHYPYGYYGHPGYYWGSWGYWGWNPYFSAQIETTLYQSEDGRPEPEPVWSATTSTVHSGVDGATLSQRDIQHFGRVIAGRILGDLG